MAKWLRHALLMLCGLLIGTGTARGNEIKRIILFKEGTQRLSQRQILEQAFRGVSSGRAGSSVFEVSSTIPLVNGYCIAIKQTRENKRGVEAALKTLENDPSVSLVQVNKRLRLIEPVKVGGREPYPPPPDGIPTGIKQHAFPKAWAAGYTGKGIRIGIADTGLCDMHKDLVKNVKGGKDCTDDPIGWVNSENHYHGMHVAGTVAADGRIKGGTPDAELYIAKCLSAAGTGSDENLLNAAQYLVDQGCQIINMSLGTQGHDAVLDEMVRKCVERNVLPVCAAGNEGSTVGTPANAPGAHAVSAIDIRNKVADFSNHGPEVRSAANGMNVLSCAPDNNGYQWLSGTSMATPHVVAAAALYRQANPNATAREISDMLVERSLNVTLPAGYGRSVNAAGCIPPAVAAKLQRTAAAAR